MDESLIDETLSNDMDALLEVVSQGSAVRNAVKIKVRQPLAEIKVQPGDPSHRRAVERFADQISEELNLKKVTLHEPAAGPLLQVEVKANPKTLGPKFGRRMREVQAGIAAAKPEWLAEQVQKGTSFTIRCPDGRGGDPGAGRPVRDAARPRRAGPGSATTAPRSPSIPASRRNWPRRAWPAR